MQRKRYRQEEHREQCLLMQWWNWQARGKGSAPELLLAIPNGGARNAATGAMLKAEGVRPGVPDMFLAIPRGGFGGLWIEMKKVAGGRVSEAQKNMLGLLAAHGFAVEVCRGFDEARAAIMDYLGWEREKNARLAANMDKKWSQPWQKWGENDDENGG